ncbi:MAG: hypothetical protein R2745_03700 [Vicinamibacterales bacterium]
MPRKLRRPKLRRASAAEIHPGLAAYLLWRDINEAADLYAQDDTSAFDLWMDEHHQAAWHAIEREALAEWVRAFPGTRPASWWWWSAPELRRVLIDVQPEPVVAALDRCHETGIPRFAWTGQPPLMESQPAYLERLGLWLSGERRRVPQAAFEPQVLTKDVLQQPRGNPRATRPR